jgi:hypothetical protein
MTIKRLNPCGRAVSEIAVRTALIYYCVHNGLYTRTVHSVPWCWSTNYCHRAGSGQEPGGVSPGAASIAFVEAAKELPAWGVQKPPRGVGETLFLGGFSAAAPAAMVEIPEGLRTRPAWWQLDRLGGRRLAWLLCLGLVVCRGIVGCQAWRPWLWMP